MPQLILSFLSGVLTSISPCILPILPLIIGSSLQKNKLAPLFIAMGLVLSFSLVGTIIVYLSSALGFDSGVIRSLGGFILLLLGSTLIFTSSQVLLQKLLGPIANIANQYTEKFNLDNLLGQFILGVLLGFVWSPCIGPTIGLAIGLAANSSTLLKAMTLMFMFSLGATLPLIIVAYGSRQFFYKRRSTIIYFGNKVRIFMGIILLAIAISILTDFDKEIEAKILRCLPGNWINLLNKY